MTRFEEIWSAGSPGKLLSKTQAMDAINFLNAELLASLTGLQSTNYFMDEMLSSLSAAFQPERTICMACSSLGPSNLILL